MILITGATGFIGRPLGRALDYAGIPWRPYTGRMNSPYSLREQLEGITTVIHLAGAEARGNKRLVQQVDVEGTRRLIEEARRAGVGRLLVPSRINANPHAMHRLLRAKGEVERLVRDSGIPYTILRTATLFGRNDRFSEVILGLAIWSWPLAWVPGGGKSPMQPLWVEDYIHCLIGALDRRDLLNRTITVAGAERLSYRDIVRTILRVTGKSRLLFPLPMTLTRPIARLTLGWWHWPPVSHFFVDRFFAPEVTDLDAISRYFSFQPARFGETITYLNRERMRWRLFRR
jgi:NADH dehydrogenase